METWLELLRSARRRWRRRRRHRPRLNRSSAILRRSPRGRRLRRRRLLNSNVCNSSNSRCSCSNITICTCNTTNNSLHLLPLLLTTINNISSNSIPISSSISTSFRRERTRRLCTGCLPWAILTSLCKAIASALSSSGIRTPYELNFPKLLLTGFKAAGPTTTKVI